MSLQLDRTGTAVILRDREGRQVLRLQDDGALVVNSGFHLLDARAFPALDPEAVEAVRDWCNHTNAIEGVSG